MRKQPSWMKGLLKACDRVSRIKGTKRKRPAKKRARKAPKRKTSKRKTKPAARRAAPKRAARGRRVRVSKPTANAIKALVRWEGGSVATTKPQTSSALVPYTGGGSRALSRRPKGVSKADWKRVLREARRGAGGERHRKRRASSHPSTADVSAWKAFLDS